MANRDWPAGLRPVISGKAGTAPRIRPYTRTSTGVIYENAPVYLSATGPACAAQTTMTPGVLGVAAHYVGVNDKVVYVYDDPEQEFLIQGDSAVATPISAIGKVCNPLNVTSGNTTTLQSACELDTSELTSVYADGDFLQVVRLWNAEDNDQDAANAKWVVKIYGRAHKFNSIGVSTLV